MYDLCFTFFFYYYLAYRFCGPVGHYLYLDRRDACFLGYLYLGYHVGAYYLRDVGYVYRYLYVLSGYQRRLFTYRVSRDADFGVSYLDVYLVLGLYAELGLYFYRCVGSLGRFCDLLYYSYQGYFGRELGIQGSSSLDLYGPHIEMSISIRSSSLILYRMFFSRVVCYGVGIVYFLGGVAYVYGYFHGSYIRCSVQIYSEVS